MEGPILPKARRRPQDSILPVIVATAMSALMVLGIAIVQPAPVLGATVTKAAACGANLRTSPRVTASRKVTIVTGTRVTIAASVSGGSWRVTCAGKRLSGRTWYRISAINGTSVKSRFGVTYLYAASGLFKSLPFTRYAACSTRLRTGTASSTPTKVIIAPNTKVTVATSVTGPRWSTTCAGSTQSGTHWYRISAINGQSVRSRYGV
jgi:hypothetical protein